MDDMLADLVALLEDWGHPPGCRCGDEVDDLTRLVEKYDF